ncbi:hypothetical protein JCM8795_01660 [Hydrogenobaculum acidophilum]
MFKAIAKIKDKMEKIGPNVRLSKNNIKISITFLSNLFGANKTNNAAHIKLSII